MKIRISYKDYKALTHLTAIKNSYDEETKTIEVTTLCGHYEDGSDIFYEDYFTGLAMTYEDAVKDAEACGAEAGTEEEYNAWREDTIAYLSSDEALGKNWNLLEKYL